MTQPVHVLGAGRLNRAAQSLVDLIVIPIVLIFALVFSAIAMSGDPANAGEAGEEGGATK